MKMTVKEFIENEFDMDIYDDVCEDLAIAKCGAYELTATALVEFADVLDIMVDVNEDEDFALLLVDEYDNWEYLLNKAVELFEGLAGYCSVNDYERWFIEK